MVDGKYHFLMSNPVLGLLYNADHLPAFRDAATSTATLVLANLCGFFSPPEVSSSLC